MNAEVISIGTELLLGHVVNTNTSYLARKLAELGIDLYHQTTVGDNPLRLGEALHDALRRSDIVITTGGLGPTVDDITVETISNLIDRRLFLNKVILKDVKEHFKLRHMKLPQDSIRQAYIPEGARPIRNRVGTAPALIIEDKGKRIICLPGPPRELEPIFENCIIPYLKRLFKGSWTIKSRLIKTTGLAESRVNRLVKDLLKSEPPTTVGIYAKLGEVDLKIMSKARNENEANRPIREIERIIKARLKNYIFGCDDETLEGAVAKILTKKRLTIAIAESCTGGLISNRLTNVSGSSKYFMTGIIAYSNESKENMFGISMKALERYGSVSKVAALAMAKGIKFLACVDIGMAITGIAGPTGGTKHKPVGLVYVALVTDRKRLVKEFRFKGSREEIKFQASQAALDLLRRRVV